MRRFWLLFYNIVVIPLLYGTFYFIALFDRKICRTISGRRSDDSHFKEKIAQLSGQGKRCWIHISSLGELEQARPVIQLLKKQIPDLILIITFFSPSGYDNAKNLPQADLKAYLPFDSFWGARNFVRSLKPDVAAIIRHDIWPNHIWQVQKAGIPLLLIDAAITEKSLRLYSLAKNFSRHLFASFSQFLAVSQTDCERLKKFVPEKKIRVIGDTRYDQVFYRAKEMSKIKFLLDSGYFTSRRILVAGSTWPSDEKHLLPSVVKLFAEYSDFILIVVPHEPTKEHVKNLETFFANRNIKSLRFTTLAPGPWDFKVFIVDTIGLLANLYALATVAYVGGSFGPGVHSVLEPAAHGCPVLFGPQHRNSHEALRLVARGGGLCVKNGSDCDQILTSLFSDVTKAKSVGKLALDLVLENLGASEKAVEAIKTALNSRSFN